MPHRPKRNGYEALDIWLSTQESEEEALKSKDWNADQQRHLHEFTDYATVNRTTDSKGQDHYRDRETGRFVKGI